MDDDEFILVSKKKIKNYEAKISKLEEENKKLKKDHISILSQKDKSIKSKKTDDLKELKSFISKKHSELQKEVKYKLEELSNLKELPTNISKELKSQSIDSQLSRELEHISNNTNRMQNDIREYNSQIISNVKLLVEHLQDSKTIEDVQSSINEIKSQFMSSNYNDSDLKTSDVELQIFEKLQEIELFMTNLRTLLSYVKPRYIERER